MIRPALLVGALVALPTFASAQGVEFDGAVTLGANFNSIGGLPGFDVDLNGYSFDFEGDLRFGEEFSVGIGAAFNTGNLQVSGAPGDINIDLIGLSVEPQFNFSNGAYAGIYYRAGDLDVALLGPLTIGIDTQSYGVFGGYDFGQGSVEGFIGTSELGENSLIPIPVGVDITDYGVSGSYQAMPELEIFGSILRTDIDFTGTTINVTAYSVGAEYDLGNGIDIYGAVGNTNVDLSDLGAPADVNALGLTLGASYNLAQAGSMPVVLSAEYSRTNLDLDVLLPGVEPEIDRFALGVTIPIGNGSDYALNSNTRTARGDYRSAVAAAINAF